MISTRSVKVFKLATALVLAMLVLFSFVLPVSAAELNCDCYCKTEEGAKLTPDGASNMLQSECVDECKSVGWDMAVCAYSPDQRPQFNTICFNEGSCKNQKGELDSFQPGECIPGMHYCYATSNEKTKLQVKIGGMTQTSDYGEYIGVAYKWLVGAASIIAIVFIMIGGLQYAVAGGHGDVAGAKKRILNAVVGLVLLLSTWLILYTVNPNLLKLEVPRFPLIRQVELLGDESCNYLLGVWAKFPNSTTAPYTKEGGAPFDSPHAKGSGDEKEGKRYTLENNTNGFKCGSMADITKDWLGEEVSDGSTCVFDYCEEPEGVCVGTGEDAECLTCKTTIHDAAIAPSTEVCGAMDAVLKQKLDTDEKLRDEFIPASRNYCFHTREADIVVDGFSLVQAAFPIVGGAAAIVDYVTSPGDETFVESFVETSGLPASNIDALMVGSCAQISMDCLSMDSCRDYDDVIVENSYEEACLDDMNDLLSDTTTLEDICPDDPCNLAPPEQSCVVMYVDDNIDGSRKNCVNNQFQNYYLGALAVPIPIFGWVVDNTIYHTQALQHMKNKDGGIDTSGEWCSMR
jgi:hypothetical protein